jgi:phage shock protein PspC (stress-responsive transcriptional regulator)
MRPYFRVANISLVKPLRHIDNLFDQNRHFLEKSAFGVCQFLGERMKINPARIRLYFIYSSFITFGSPFILYLVIAFWLNVHKYVSSGAKRFLSE